MMEIIQTALSPAAKKALEGIDNLSIGEKFAVFRQVLADLAEVVNRASPTTGEKMNSVLLAEVADANTVKNDPHGFRIVHDAAGEEVVKFSKLKDDGTTETYLLSKGARGVARWNLEQYGEDQLNGAKIKTHSELEMFVIQHLSPAIQGLQVKHGKLQTDDKALKLACSILVDGVRTENGKAYIELETENGVVSGCQVLVLRPAWFDFDFLTRHFCAFFGD